MTQPNPELWGKFVEAVKAGRIDGLTYEEKESFNAWIATPCDEFLIDGRNRPEYGLLQNEIDHLCAELRRWMEGKGWRCLLASDGLTICRLVNDPEGRKRLEDPEFKGGTELDRHLAAALWVLEREV